MHDGTHPAWRQFETADGVPYFHNAMLGKSTWDKPRALFSRQVRILAEHFTFPHQGGAWSLQAMRDEMVYDFIVSSAARKRAGSAAADDVPQDGISGVGYVCA